MIEGIFLHSGVLGSLGRPPTRPTWCAGASGARLLALRAIWGCFLLEMRRVDAVKGEGDGVKNLLR